MLARSSVIGLATFVAAVLLAPAPTLRSAPPFEAPANASEAPSTNRAPLVATELIQNGDFAQGVNHWQTFATPDSTYLVSNIAGGLFEFYRLPPPAGTTNQATIFQNTGAGFPANTALTAGFDLRNTSAVRKRISVLVLDADFSDLSVCTFWLPANAPMRRYGMGTHTAKAWANASIYFYAASANGAGDTGYYGIDNVSMQDDPAGSAIRTDCLDPTAPAPGFGGAGPNLLTNGDFNAGLPPWGTFGTLTSQVASGVFEFIKPSGVPPAGVVLQQSGDTLAAGEIVTASFALGNSSSVRKRVTVIMHDADFSDLSACTFWLPAGLPLSPYSLRTFTTKAWTNATVSVYPATVGLAQWIRLDDVALQRTPAVNLSGTECVEPAIPLALALTPASSSLLTLSSATLTAAIAVPAPAGGLTVNLASSASGVANVPSSVLIPAGQLSVAVPVTTATTPGAATISASAPAITSATSSLTVNARGLVVGLASGTVAVGGTVNGTVTLTQPAPVGGVTIALGSTNLTAATVPAQILIAEAATVGNFVVTGAGNGTTTITATAPGFTIDGANLTASLTLALGPTPFDVERFDLVNATATLSTLAPTGGFTVTLESDNPAIASVPASVVIPAGGSVVDVPVTGVVEGTTTIRATGLGVPEALLTVHVLPPSPADIQTSPGSGEGDVAVTRETILRFSRPLGDPSQITAARLFATFAGATLSARIHVSPDAKTVTLFYNQSLPASARVRVFFDTTGLVDAYGVPLDGDQDDAPGGMKTIDFDTLTLTTLAGTSVAGRVFASELGDGGVNTPLAGVQVSVDGLETTLWTTTDAMGNFTLSPAPVGEFFVHIDGRTATNGVPVGASYPTVGKKWTSVANQATDIGNVYLPLIVADTLQPVSLTQDTTITFPAAVLAANPSLSGVQITVPADSLYADSGARGGMVGIAPVAPDRLPSPLPPGLEFPLVITVQTDGASNFDAPGAGLYAELAVAIDGPLEAGAKSAFWSFNHDIGDWEIVGPMTVTTDGSRVCTDEGVGILQPGWGGTTPGTSIDYYLTGLFLPPEVPGTSSGWPPPLQISRDPVTGTYRTNGNLVKGATEQEAADNREAILRCINASTMCVVGSAGANTFGASSLPSIIGGERLDHVAIAYLDQTEAPPVIRILEMQVGPDATPNDLESAIFGSPTPVPRSLDQFAGTVDRVTVVPTHLSPTDVSQLVLAMGTLTAQGSTYSLKTNGNTCSSSIANAMRQAGIDATFGLPVADWNIVTPGHVIEYWEERNRNAALMHAQAWPPARRGRADHTISQDVLIPTHLFYRIEFSTANGQVSTIRGSNFGRRFRGVLPAFANAYVSTFDSLSGALAGALIRTEAAGSFAEVSLDPTIFVSSTTPDIDSDGLTDIAEGIVGTRIDTADTDSDGISDGAEIAAGTNPLDGSAVAAGLIATVDTLGNAVDIAARNDVAVVADSDRGIAVVNVASTNPIIVAQVDTPGTASAVALQDTLVAVADGPAGLAIVDISNPTAAQIVRQIEPLALGGEPTSVTVSAGTVYVGLWPARIAVVDLATGAVVETVTLNASSAVDDVAIERDTLYALTRGIIHAIPLASPLQVSGTASGPEFFFGFRRRLFAGGEVAYGTYPRGYSTFSLTNPAHPALIMAGTAPQFGWRQIVTNGSGLGLAAVGVNSSSLGDISLYDVSDPASITGFLTEFATPGSAAAVAIYNGLGYVADGQSGLQVLNYRAYDSNGVPPTVALSGNFALTGTTGVAEEGQVMRLTAAAADDVQVRNVDFFINGALASRDGNFPFEHRFVTPSLAVQPTFMLRACASDTGGGRTCTADILVTLVPDATPPIVLAVSPTDGAYRIQNSLTVVSARFNEPLAAASLTPSTFQVYSAGPDLALGTPDDFAVAGATIGYNALSKSTSASFPTPLPIGHYRVVLRQSITDLAGNPLPADYTWIVHVKDNAVWVADGDGFWDDPTKWSDGVVPLDGDFVVIDRPTGSYTITYRTGTLSIATLTSAERLVVSGGTLKVQTHATLSGGLTLTGGSIGGAGLITAASLDWSAGAFVDAGEVIVTGPTVVASAGSMWMERRALKLGPITTWSTSIGLNDGATIINPVGGTWSFFGDVTMGGGSGGAAITNLGTLRTLPNTGLVQVHPRFDNAGVVDVQAGELSFFGGGTATGLYSGAAGTTLAWRGAVPFVLEANGQVSTLGTASFGGQQALPPIVTVRGSFAADTLIAASGSITFVGAAPTIHTAFSAATSVVTFDTPGPVHLGAFGLHNAQVLGTADFTASSFTTTGGYLNGSGTLSVSGTTSFPGPSAFALERRLLLGPQTEFNGHVGMTSTGEIVNPVGGIFTAVFGAISSGGGNSRFVNFGTLRKTGPGTLGVGRFDNPGSVDVQAGTLSLQGAPAGSATGSFTGSPGSTIQVSSYTFDTGSAVNTSGTVEFGPSWDGALVKGAFSAATVVIPPFAFTGPTFGPQFVGAVGTVGNLVLNGHVTMVDATSALSISSLTVAGGYLAGSASLTIGSLDWTSGGFGWTGPGGTLSVTSATTGGTGLRGVSGWTVTLGPTTSFTGGVTSAGAAGVIVNPAGGVWTVQGDEIQTASGSFHNAGVVILQSGEITVGAGTSTGNFTAAADTTLAFEGPHVLAAGSQINSSGTVVLNGATVAGSLSAAQLIASWNGALISGTVGTIGDLQIGLEGSITLNSLAPVFVGTLSSVAGALEGTAAVTTGSLEVSGGTVSVPALTVTGQSTFGEPPPGHVPLQLIDTTLTFGTSTSWAPDLTVRLSGDASIVNPSGSIWELQGPATIVPFPDPGTMSVVNAGEIRFANSPAWLAMNGVSFSNTGTLVMRLSDAITFDRFIVSGPVSLAGTLDVRLLNGFLPASGQTFSVLTYGSHTGTFTSVNGNGETYDVAYGPAAVTVSKP